MKRLIIGISGSSGVICGIRLLEILRQQNIFNLVNSTLGRVLGASDKPGNVLLGFGVE